MWSASEVQNKPAPVSTIPTPQSPQPVIVKGALGVDVSHHNGKVDWVALKKAGIKFAYVKLTEGIKFLDPRAIMNVQGANEVGIPVGVYHFFHPGFDAIEQAKFFLNSAKGLKLQLIHDCDWEVHDDCGEAAEVSQIKLFRDYVEKASGKVPMTYTGKWFIDEVDAKEPKTPLPDWLTESPLWISDYTPASVAIPKPWTSYALLQYTEKGTLPGVQGQFDLNTLNVPLSLISF